MTDHHTALWEFDKPAKQHTHVPAWIDQEITGATIAAICQGGCDSGAYMPAVTYHEALETMSEHGDDVLAYIEDFRDVALTHPKGISWSGMACFYLSFAVEIWAHGAADELVEALEEGSDGSE